MLQTCLPTGASCSSPSSERYRHVLQEKHPRVKQEGAHPGKKQMKNPDYNQWNCEKQLRKEAGGKSERHCSAYLIQLISTQKTATLLQGVRLMAQKQL